MIPNVWVTNSVYSNEKRSHRKDQIATYRVKTFLSGVCVCEYECVCVCVCVVYKGVNSKGSEYVNITFPKT